MGSNPIGPTNTAEPGTGILADNHVHSQWSHDTGPDASMAAACARAVAIGLGSVAFTEHLDFTVAGPADPITSAGIVPNSSAAIRPLDVAGYLAGVAECRGRFPALRILSGVEAGEPHLFTASATAVLGSGRFDRVLGSLHGLPLGQQIAEMPALYEQRPAADVVRAYLAEVPRLIEGFDGFSVLAHLDYPLRYWPAEAGPFDPGAFQEELRDVLRILAGSGRVLEINTSRALSPEITRWWYEAGGTAVSFGSDAHDPASIAHRFSEAAAMAEAIGFRPGRHICDYWPRLGSS